MPGVFALTPAFAPSPALTPSPGSPAVAPVFTPAPSPTPGIPTAAPARAGTPRASAPTLTSAAALDLIASIVTYLLGAGERGGRRRSMRSPLPSPTGLVGADASCIHARPATR